MGRLTLAASMLLPAVVFGAVGAWWGRDQPFPLSAAALRNDEALAQHPPRVLLVGNSKSHSDIDAALLGRELGVGSALTGIRMHGSSAPAWYAMTEQRVYDQGYQPELILYYGQLPAMLRAEASTAGELEGLLNQMTRDSEVIDRKVFRRHGGALGRINRSAIGFREDLLDAVRTYSVGWTLAPAADEGARAAGDAWASAALGRLFAGGGTVEVRRAIPIAEAPNDPAMLASEIPPEQTLLPDLVELAREHGARVVFVRAPNPPARAKIEAVPPAVERAALRLLADLGASYVDLSGLPLGPTDFVDDYHASHSGRAIITAALARALVEADVLGGGVAEPVLPVVARELLRVGTPPPLRSGRPSPAPGAACAQILPLPGLQAISSDALARAGFELGSPVRALDADGPLDPDPPRAGFGATCSGGAIHRPQGLLWSPRREGATVELALDPAPSAWVYPGTALEWRFDALEAGPVELVARAPIGATATLVVGEQRLPLTPAGRVLRASAEAPAATTRIAVEAGADTWLVISSLRAGGPRGTLLLGQAPSALNLLAGAGRTEGEAPPIHLGQAVEEGRRIRVPALGTAHFDGPSTRARLGVSCSPLQVDLGAGWTALGNVRHEGDSLLSPPGLRAARIDPGHGCVAGDWIHPGERRRLSAGRTAMRALGLGADRLYLRGASFSPGGADASLSLELEGGDGLIRPLSVQFPGGGPLEAGRCFVIDPPLPPDGGVRLTAVNRDPAASILLWAATLAEHEFDVVDCGASARTE